MDVEVNQEQVNNRAKLMMHRLVARRLAHQPTLIALAGQALARATERDPGRECFREWEHLLRSSTFDLRRILTRRNETMERLRLTSPFMVLPEIGLQGPELRRRIWRKAKKGAGRLAATAPEAASPFRAANCASISRMDSSPAMNASSARALASS